jgi:hypothetical protein
MSKSLYIVLEDNKKNIFEHFDEPLTYIKAYQRKHDGYGFLTHIMETNHPHLKKGNKKPTKSPLFVDYDIIPSGVKIKHSTKFYIQQKQLHP